MTKLKYDYICHETGAALFLPDAFVFDSNLDSGGWDVTSRGVQSIKVPAGTFTTKWIKTLSRGPQCLSYETCYLMLFRGRPIVTKKAIETDMELSGEFHQYTEAGELISLPKL